MRFSSRRSFLLACGVAVFALVSWQPTSFSDARSNPPPAAPPSVAIEIQGRTQCVPRRKAIIAPVPLHPVEEVLVSLGDHVKKGQPLVKLDSDEQQAEVRAKKATLENAGIALKEARRCREAMEKYANSISEQKVYESRFGALKAEMDERVAKAALEAAEAELEHYTIVAPIDGVVNLLDVNVGAVSRPGTTVWGEILDLSEIDVRCELTPEQADQIAIGQSAEVRSVKKKELLGVAQVAFIGFSASKVTHLVPVILRLPNPKWRVRCEVPVDVRILEVRQAGK